MSTQTIHPSTSHGAHAGPPGDSAQASIAVLRNHIRSAPSDTGLVRRFLLLLAERNHLIAALGLRLVEAEHARDLCAADALAVRSYLREVEAERDGLARENRALARTLLGIQAHIDETNAAWRVASENHAGDQALIEDLRAQLAAARAESGYRGRWRRST